MSTAGSTLSTKITSGALNQALSNGEYILIKWTATYIYKEITYYSYTYSYVYKTPTGETATLAAGGSASTTKNIINWAHSSMTLAATVYAFGLHKIDTKQTVAYKFGPYSGFDFAEGTGTQMTGSGYTWRSDSSSGGSSSVNTTGEVGYIYADRSRINNFSQIPNLILGFDINTSDEETDYTTDVGAKLYFGSKTVDKNCLYKFDCSADTHSVYTRYNESSSMTATSVTHGTRHMEEHSGTRLYKSDNSNNSTKLTYALPSADMGEVQIPLTGYAKGHKSDRSNTVEVTIHIAVININKNDLRAKLNDSIKFSYQENWFSSKADWTTYQAAIIAAAKVLGNPAADEDAITDAVTKLENATDNVKLKTGTAVVKHYWTFGGNTGLIHTENSYTYTYSDNLAANAISIDGYEYANRFECYANGVQIDSGIESFDNASAAADTYEWRFYYYPNAYSVSYDTGLNEPFSPNSGSGSNANYGQNYVITDNYPSRTGYTFDGWYLDVADKTFSSSETIKWQYKGDGIFTAHWNPITYTIAFDLNGGDESSFNPDDSYKSVQYDASYTLPETIPTKTGYTFMGWKLNGGDTYTASGQFTWTIASNSTFVAQWTNTAYTVTFDPVASDATVSPAQKAVYYDKAYGTLATASRTGYTAQWYSNSSYSSSSLVTESTVVKIAADHKLYAKWTPTNYTITYNLDGGTVVGTNPTSYTIESANFTLKNPEKTGYNFAGWSGTGISTSAYAPSVTVTKGSYGNRTYTAHWSAIDYKITYTLNGGVNDAANPSSYTYADSVTIKPATRTGYTFTGWTGSGVTNAQQVSIAKGSTGDRSYSAGWSIINYTITYDLAGGSVSGNPTSYNIESNAITLQNPVKTGYTFAGWQSNYYNGTELTVVIPKGSYGNKTFTAVWSNNGYVITYDLAGGSVNGTNPNGYNKDDEFTLINPVREGYTFAGWIKTDVSTGTSASAAMTAGINPSDVGNKKFTATWTARSYTIAYDLGGGRIETAAGNPTSYTPDSAAITLVNPVRAGYKFSGWSGTGLGGIVTQVVIASGSIGNRAYTANWETVNYNIKYDLNGGADTGLPTQYTATDALTIGAPVRTGYTFTGWNRTYEDFTWKEGFINLNTGYYETLSTYPDSVYSSPIVLRAGVTYSLSTASSGGISDLRLRTFNLDGTYNGSVSTVNYTPSSDCIGYILAYQGHTTQALRNSVKLTVSGISPTVVIKSGSTGNMKLEASWSVDVYTLTYDLAGGTLAEENPASYTTETPTFTLNNPEKAGYDFIGWLCDGVTNSVVTINQGSTGNKSFTAVWSDTVYTITYDLGGGTVSGGNPVSYTCNTASFTLNNPTKTGYTFGGWSGTGISGVSSSVTVAKGSMGNRSYVATWTPQTYTITYNLDGGTNSSSNPRSYTVETESFTLAYPTKSGAVFTGWTGTDIDGASTSVTVSKGSTGNRTYTATWDISTYTITYNLDGGTLETSNPTSYTVESEPITLARPTRTGYDFAGWSGTGINGISEYVTIPTGSTGNRSYTANWSTILYTISYSLGSGAELDTPNPDSYFVESTTFTLNNPVRSGYIFAGWTGTDLSSPQLNVTIPKGSTGNRNYTANWTVDSYVITYSLNGGTLAADNPTSYTVNSADITLNNPTREGYRFTGWSGTGISGTGISTTVVIPKGSMGNRNYEANWELETYTITYNLDGGTETVANPTTYNYLSAPITLYSPTKPGYSFLGWESNYFDGTKESVTIATNSTGDKDFVAKWELGVYTITYNLNGGKVNGTNPTTYAYSTASFTLINPTKTGYVFAGWSGTGISGTMIDVEIPQGSSGNREYTANWGESNNIITYNLNGGVIEDGANPTSYVTNSGTITLENPSRVGYSFAGWSGTGITGTSVSVTFDTAGGGSRSYTANWTPINYRIVYNLNGGKVAAGNPRTYTIEDAFTLNNPTRTGYTFDGWKGTSLDDNYTYQTVNVVKGSTGNRTYTAVWSEQVYSITYDYNGGSTDFANPTSYTIASEAITLYNPTRTGYVFEGWTGTGYSTPTKNAVIPMGSTGNKSFTANYTQLSFLINYYGVENAKFTPNATSYSVDSAPITLATPTRVGYNFLGWKGTGIVGTALTVTIPTGSSGDRTYTAQWEPITYTVTYDLGGGTVSGEVPATYTVESHKLSILNPGRAGFTFLGWTQSFENLGWSKGFINISTGNIENSSSYPNSMYSDAIVLRSGVTYTLSGASYGNLRWRIFNIDGTYNKSVTAATFTPTEDCICYILDYGDLGDSVRSAIKVTANNKIIDASIAKGSMGNMTFTANWSAQSFTISYKGLEGASVTTNPTSYSADSAAITLNNPSKTGYTFLGWTGTDLMSATTDVVIPTGSSGNRVYTATWKLETYTIAISLNGGTLNGTVPDSFTVNSASITLPTPTKSGYRFVGWQGTGITGTADSVTIAAGSTGSRSYTAVWEENTSGKHTINFYGYNKELIQSVEIAVGQAIVPPTPTIVVGYQFKSWSIDYTQAIYVNSVDDIDIYAEYTVGPDTYTIIINGVSGTYGQYETVTAKADAIKDGQAFSYWIDGNGDIVSYYRSYSFKAHANETLEPVYGATSGVKAATRVTKIEYNAQYDWITVYAERSVASDYTVLQHGIIFTDDASIAADTSKFVIGTSGVKVSTAKGRNRSGVYTLSIGNLSKYGDYIYARSYVKVVDADGNVSVVYSDVSDAFYNYHKNPSSYQG